MKVVVAEAAEMRLGYNAAFVVAVEERSEAVAEKGEDSPDSVS